MKKRLTLRKITLRDLDDPALETVEGGRSSTTGPLVCLQRPQTDNARNKSRKRCNDLYLWS